MYLYSSFMIDRYLNLFDNINQNSYLVKIISNKSESDYKNKYIGKIIQKNSKINNAKVLIYLNKDMQYEYGDIVLIKGNFDYAKCRKNYKGFDYRRILWQNKIFGIITGDKTSKVKKSKSIIVSINIFKNKLEKNIDELFSQDEANFIKSIIFGEKDDISKKLKKILKMLIYHIF